MELKGRNIKLTHIGIIVIYSMITNLLAYSSEGDKGIGYIIYSFIGLGFYLGYLLLMSVSRYLMKDIVAGKRYFLSILYAIAIYFGILILWAVVFNMFKG